MPLETAPVISVRQFPRLEEYVGIWAMEPRAAAALWHQVAAMDLAAHVAQGPRAVTTYTEKAPIGQKGQYIAIISLVGAMMKQEASGMESTSTIRLRRDIRLAKDDPKCLGILLAIDSPGGTVSGTDDLAADVRAARQVKPVWVQIEDLGASAAYWIASQADKVFANSDTALVGSIGTLLTVYDFSEWAKAEGIKTLVFSTGPIKGAGVEGAAITAEQAAYFQKIVDQTQKTFDAAVQAGRRFDADQLAAIRTGEVFVGPEAVRRGLVDGIQPLETTFAALAALLQSAPRAGRQPTGNLAMDPETNVQPAETAAADLAAYRQAQAAESRRVAALRALCARAGNPTINDAQGRPASLEAQAIAEGWDETRCELEVLRAARPRAPQAAGGRGPEITAQVLEASLLQSVGFAEPRLVSLFGAATVEAAQRRGIRGLGLAGLCHQVCAAAGLYLPPGRLDNEGIRTIFRADQILRAEGDFSTISLSGILSNVANKALLESFTAVDAVGPTICAARDTNDFKPFTTYRLTASGTIQKVGPDGELKHMGLQDETFTNQLDTRGATLVLTRQMLINDDLGAFIELPRLLGRASILSLEEAVFTLILANTGSFFAGAHDNYFDGADTALGVDAIKAGQGAFLAQVDANGKPILVRPAILLVPTALAQLAKDLMTSQWIMQLAEAKIPTQNTLAGAFRVAASPYLDAQGLTGSSAKGWYLLADPAQCPAFQIGYLRGQRNPIVEPGQTDFDVLGIKWRCYWDFGVAQLDWRGAQFNKGQA